MTGDAAGRPRVLAVTHLYPSNDREHRGPWVVEQVDALAASTDISVLCCSQTAENRVEVRPSGVEVTFRSTRTFLGPGRLGLLGSSVRYDRALRGYLRSHPDLQLLHAHFGIPDAILVRRQAARARLPYLVTLHGDDAFKVLPRADAIGRAVRRAVSQASAVICVSEAMARAVTSVVDVPTDVIPNGYDDRLFRLSNEPRDSGLLFVGNLVPTKNVALLLRAYARIRTTIAMPLTVVGDGPLRSSLVSLATELGVSQDVRFLGVQSRTEVAGLMARARLLALPSLSEGWGVVIAESLACGTPVVASRVGGVPEIVGSPDGGVLVPPGDEDALAAALADVARRRPDRQHVAAASRALPWTIRAQEIAAVYRRILGQP